ncbi:MAG: glucans biosynthesis glucosyltransferase MdoH [Thermodesulfobacteriota bacterium]
MSEGGNQAAADLAAERARRTAERRAGPLLEVPADRLFQDWQGAQSRALAYLAALGLEAEERAMLAREAVQRALHVQPWRADSDAVAETLRALEEILEERGGALRAPWDPETDPFLAWRVERAFGPAPAAAEPGAALPMRDGVLWSGPPLLRGSMVPEKIERRFLRRLFRRRRAGSESEQPRFGAELRRQRRKLPWTRVAARRRLLLVILVLIPSIIASGFMVNVLPDQGSTWIEVAIVVLFGALFGWISIGFWTATLGFFTLVGRRDRFAITTLADAPQGEPITPEARTAIVMPIAEEPVERVFAGLKAIHASLERAGVVRHFDFFILSDSSSPDTAAREEVAWATWCREIGGFDHVFYRRRRIRQKRKSGNVADFCRRWGRKYRYMVMLDADSLMTGDSLAKLVRMMERSPEVGLIQTVPVAVNRRSLLARVQQFASHVSGPMFAAGLHYWQLGDGQYWGHNAIIRIEPFMRHCGLPRLSGKPPLGGEILSHDFVEAALLGRAGWTLWLAFDLPGSYEEVPSTLLEEMKRDRRWCQGNLQHLRLLFSEGLFGAHRVLFLNGALSYVSAMLWFAFLALSTVEAVLMVLREPDYFPDGPSLFPDWPIWRPDWALSLLAVTAAILFLPKLLSILLVALRGRTRAHGGLARLFASVLVELLLSTLLAPIRMVFHTRFVVQNLLGRTVTWKSQGREDAETGWGEALRHHGLDTLFATAWGVGLYWLNPDYFWWVTPIIAALLLSVPTSVLSSRVSLGERARRLGLFLTPEETSPPQELRDLWDNERAAQEAAASLPAGQRDGLMRALVDPYVNALHRALLRRPRSLRESIRVARAELAERLVRDGARTLSAREQRTVFHDPQLVDRLHADTWQLPGGSASQGRTTGA